MLFSNLSKTRKDKRGKRREMEDINRQVGSRRYLTGTTKSRTSKDIGRLVLSLSLSLSHVCVCISCVWMRRQHPVNSVCQQLFFSYLDGGKSSLADSSGV